MFDAAGRVLQPAALLVQGLLAGSVKLGRAVPGAPAGPARLRVVTWNIGAAIGPASRSRRLVRHVRPDRVERIAGILACSTRTS